MDQTDALLAGLAVSTITYAGLNRLQGNVAQRYRVQEEIPPVNSGGEGGNNTNFTGQLRGEDVTLNDVTVQKISYVKCSFDELQNLRNEFNVDLSNEYVKILRTVNGIEFNGFILYGIDQRLLEKQQNQRINGLIECNKIWYENEWQRQHIF